MSRSVTNRNKPDQRRKFGQPAADSRNRTLGTRPIELARAGIRIRIGEILAVTRTETIGGSKPLDGSPHPIERYDVHRRSGLLAENLPYAGLDVGLRLGISLGQATMHVIEIIAQRPISILVERKGASSRYSRLLSVSWS